MCSKAMLTDGIALWGQLFLLLALLPLSLMPLDPALIFNRSLNAMNDRNSSKRKRFTMNCRIIRVERERKNRHRNRVQCMCVFGKICHSMFGSRFIFNFGFWSKSNSKWKRKKCAGNIVVVVVVVVCFVNAARFVCNMCTESLHCYQLDWNDFRMGSLCHRITLTVCMCIRFISMNQVEINWAFV